MRKFKLGTLRRPKPSDSFTLIELLTVMAIIAILAALILAAGNGVITKGLRSRTSAEIQAMSTAAEGYKTDNGIYPQGDGVLLTNSVATPYQDTTIDGASSGDEYQLNSALLYQALSGQTNFSTAPISGTKVYMPLRVNQVGNVTTGNTYIMDPWKHSYGYSTGTTSLTQTNYPYNGTGFFDLWSTAGVTKTQVGANSGLTNTWISNWTQ